MRGSRRLIVFVVGANAACAAIVGFGDLQRLDPVTPPSEAGVNATISLGANHSCAVMVDQTVRCWGQNNFGQLGVGGTENKTTPVVVPGLAKVTFLSLGVSHSCAVTVDGSTLCWGSNESAQLGIGPPDSAPHDKPTVVLGAAPAKKVQAGKSHTCIETLTKTAECWGANESGQLGDGTTTAKSVPTPVTGLAGVEKLSAGSGPYNCAVAQAADAGGRAVFCWGLNDQGQLGQPTATVPSSPLPLAVAGVSQPEKVFVGRGTACATLPDTSITCWGANAHGQLGDGTFASRSTPAPVNGVLGMSEVSPAFDHTCGNEDGTGRAKCWGSNAHGQLGLGTIGGDDQPTPQALDGTLWDAVTTDGDHSCGRRQGVSYCWGRNDFGQLGNGTTADSGKPALVKF